MSDCNKARIASTWSANPMWSESWSQNPAAVCPSPPPPPFQPGLTPQPQPQAGGGDGTIIIVVVAVVAAVAILGTGTIYYLRKAKKPSKKAPTTPAQPSESV